MSLEPLESDSEDKHVIFSDVDGTLVHYPSPEAQQEVWADDYGSIIGPSVHKGFNVYKDTAGRKHKVLRLPPSSTGLQGIIGLRALASLSNLRINGLPLILVSGARTSTVLQRLPYLPIANAYVIENGGRIFLHTPSLPTAAPLLEDTEWRQRHTAVAGSPDQEGGAPEQRRGLLWDVHRKFVGDGWVTDTAGYSTGFRVTLKGGQSRAELASALALLPEELACSFNLGVADVYPATSGKANAARYLMKLLGVQPRHCSLLCDDDNDLGLAAEVGHVFVVSKTSESIVRAAAAEPDKFTVAKSGGLLATEEMLQALGDHLGTYVMG